MKKEEAVIHLQYLWKNKFKHLTTYRLIEHLFSIGFTIEHIESINFNSLVNFLKKKSILSANKVCLQRIYQLCIFRHGSYSHNLENINIRVFLAGFMIVYHPNSVFYNIGTIEKALIEATKPLLTNYQNICKAIYMLDRHSFQDVPYELTKDFLTMLFKYFECFKAWKEPDVVKLICRIKSALNALYQAEENIIDIDQRIEFNINIERLRNKLQQIAGV